MTSGLEIDSTSGWTLRDYVSPGLRTVRLDHAFPHMRPGDLAGHPWKYLRRDVPHRWYADERFPLMGFLNRDEASLLHNIALQFAGKRALEIGSWLGWSTAHLAAAGVDLDSIDPAHDDAVMRASVKQSLSACGLTARVRLAGGRSPDRIASLGGPWSLFFIDGDHAGGAPLRDALACLPFATADCAFVFHDVAAPAVATAVRALAERGFQVLLYQTAQVMALAWRGNVVPVVHIADPDVAWQIPAHLADLPFSDAGYVSPARTDYPALADIALSGAAERPTVCIVTSEIIGPFKNGGIGTATTGLAELLANDGMKVTVLYTGAVWAPDTELREWRTKYGKRGIQLDALSFDEMKTLAGPLRDAGFGVPWLVLRYLSSRHFDVIHFNDCCGEGSLALASKKLGLALQQSLLVLALHGPSRWVLDLNDILPDLPLLTAFDHAERLSIRCADLLWSPSRYLLGWATSHGFRPPARTFVQQYALPAAASERVPAYGPSPAPREIVFFGRLEDRKGLRVFCNAVHMLRDVLAERGITVTFLGKPQACQGMPSMEYISRRAAEWKFAWRTITDLGQPEALELLSHGEKLAVMPSPLDNSPCTVYETLANGIPFLAARTGGIPELIDPADRERVLFDYSSDALRNALDEVIERGGWIARPAFSQEGIRRTWLAAHHRWRSVLPPPALPSAGPLSVAVVIDHTSGLAGFDRTLHSALRSPSVRRIIVINRRGEKVPVPSVDLLTADPSAYETELADVTEDVVLMIHSGVGLADDALDLMTIAMQTAGVDGLQPASSLDGTLFSRIAPPLGGSAAFSLLSGPTFTGALLVRREVLIAAKQGHALAVESPFMGVADFCVAGSQSIWPYPAVALEQPLQSVSELTNSIPSRVAAYREVSADERYYMLANAYGAAKSGQRILKRELALRALDFGFGFAVRAASWGRRRLLAWVRS